MKQDLVKLPISATPVDLLGDQDKLSAALTRLSSAGSEARGSVYTRSEVVEAILDMVGYVESRPLHEMAILEPSFGAADFLLPVIRRLVAAWKAAGCPEGALTEAVRAVEIHGQSHNGAVETVTEALRQAGVPDEEASAAANRWLIHDDFLLARFDREFDFVVGNPPYVRQEAIDPVLMATYRSRYATIFDRADLYVPFIERSLRLLKTGGSLGFICADRWTKNKYGGPLRKFVSTGFRLVAHVDLTGAQPFHAEVDAYPAVTVIRRQEPGPATFAHAADLPALGAVARDVAAGLTNHPGILSASGSAPWIAGSADQASVLRRLEASLPDLESAGCRVGIGVATGADKAFIGDYETMDVEEDRKIPIVMTRDVDTGVIRWRGRGVINPFNPDGGLVNLALYPRLRSFLEERRDAIEKRHVARKAPERWYRTIDRIWPELVSKPKILIPDIKGEPFAVVDEGRFYPHHNLYFVLPGEWEVRALQTVLSSPISRFFVSAYSTRMRGGFLRFQAQYLRRIRLPKWSDVPDDVRAALIAAASPRQSPVAREALISLYALTDAEFRVIFSEGQESADRDT